VDVAPSEPDQPPFGRQGPAGEADCDWSSAKAQAL